ncbi:MAG: cytochrome b/b6 domain-containing protein [Nitratireductor sp.]|nr:cytochrome b/b6 domain-containing protein [Nitratireductor sp.]
MSPTINRNAYSATSIWVHWLTAILVVALFFTHESERGSTGNIFHVSGGILIALFFFWRIMRRMRNGISAKPDQSELLNWLSRIVLWGIVLALLVVSVTGLLLPWTGGRAIDLFGLSIPSPITGSRSLHGFFEEVHDIAGHAFIPLVALHVLGVVKHAFMDADKGVVLRMTSPDKNGL